MRHFRGKKYRNEHYLPSAYQIRSGGIKGVLAVDPSLPGKQWSYRDSMHKYHSNHTELEFIVHSKPSMSFLLVFSRASIKANNTLNISNALSFSF